MSDTHSAASAYATLVDGGRAIMSADGTEFRIVLVQSGSLATRMCCILLYATLMSLLGHVVLSLLIDGFNALTDRSTRNREGAVQLEEGFYLEDEELASDSQSTDPSEKLLLL